jgi:integrase/recombinase XerD
VQMEKPPQITVYLDTRKKKANGKYPVKLKVYTTIRKYYSTIFDLTESEFNSIYLTTRPRKEHKELRNKLIALESKARTIAETITPFTFEEFERKLYRKQGAGANVNYHYQQKIDELNKREQINTSSTYELSRKSIILFLDTEKKFKQLSFQAISVSWLEDYERFMTVTNGRSATTVSMYLRALRTLFNNAIALNDIESTVYPFGRKKYQMPSSQNIKKALDKVQLKALFNAIPQSEQQQKAKDFWFFSYSCNGMNIKDIAQLKYSDISDDKFVFVRAKTLNTSKSNLKKITVRLNSFSKEVIKKYGKATTEVFNIIDKTFTAEEKQRSTKSFTRFINQHMKALCKANELPEDISTYTARHSFASNYVDQGATVVDAMESLGHSNIATTQNYLKSLRDKNKNTNTMMDFD